MADQVDQTFVKVHFHKMKVEYSNWLVDWVVDRETDMVLMRETFQGWQGQARGSNNKCKRRDRGNNAIDIDGTSDQPKKRKLKKI